MKPGAPCVLGGKVWVLCVQSQGCSDAVGLRFDLESSLRPYAFRHYCCQFSPGPRMQLQDPSMEQRPAVEAAVSRYVRGWGVGSGGVELELVSMSPFSLGGAPFVPLLRPGAPWSLQHTFLSCLTQLG